MISMEAKINIAEILKNKPQGTKLYSPFYGNCILAFPEDMTIKDKSLVNRYFYDDGRGCLNGEIMLFPSKEMRDWHKFSWKKGDVLVSNYGRVEVIFERFKDESYTSFVGKHFIDVYDENNEIQYYEEEHICNTVNFIKASNKATQTYINAIEERLGSKLNMETLEIEKSQPEFKDGDILSQPDNSVIGKNYIFILNEFDKYKNYKYYVALTGFGELDFPKHSTIYSRKNKNVHYATEAEKQQLFSALAKKRKAWDAEKKKIVDLKPKFDELKPFDRCIWKIRNCEGSIWKASFVSYVDEYGATPMGVSIDEDLVNLIILPYNDQTKLLLGTTDEWKGGEQ